MHWRLPPVSLKLWRRHARDERLGTSVSWAFRSGLVHTLAFKCDEWTIERFSDDSMGVTWFADAFLLARIERNACALATNRCENRPGLKLQTLFVVCAKPEPPYSGPIGAFWETAVNQEPSFRFPPSYHGPDV